MVKPELKRDVATALACAEAFLRVAEPLVLGIRRMEESTQAEPLLIGIGDAVAAATNLSFAIELYIKAILFKVEIDVSPSHDLGKLYAAMPQHFRVLIEKRYEETRRSDWDGKYPSVTVAKRPGPANLPKWDDSSKSLGSRSTPQTLGRCFHFVEIYLRIQELWPRRIRTTSP